MRRSELSSNRIEDYEELIAAPVGHIGIIDENNYPRIIPINFVVFNDAVYFHGALSGEKYNLIKKEPKATFSIDIPYSYIPSSFTSKKYACNSTHFFKSMHIRGIASIVISRHDKISALQKLMEKYQPENDFEPVNSRLYNNAIDNVGIFKITILEKDIKAKFGQNEDKKIRDQIIKNLEIRGLPIDKLTIDEMKKLNS